MMRRASIGIALLVLTHLVSANASSALAQSGSVGGTIGKQDKSVSGGEEQRTPRPKPASTATPKNDPCQKVVGSWSWIVAGMTDRATFLPNHTGTHTQGGNGEWSCSGGQYQVTWTLNRTDRFTLSADGATLSGTSSAMGMPLSGKRLR